MNGIALFTVTYQGLTTIGGCTAVGVKVGDRILQHYRPNGAINGSYFEFTVSVDDEIQQVADVDASSETMQAVVFRELT